MKSTVIPGEPGGSGAGDAGVLLASRTPLAEHPLSADSKAGTVLTILGIMFTVLARYSSVLGDLLKHGGMLKWMALSLVSLFILLAFASVIQVFRTLMPRFPKAEPTLAFFGDITRLSREEYQSRVEAMSESEAMEHIVRYNHTNAQIVVIKFREMRRCVRMFQFTFYVWVALVLLVVGKLA